MLHSLLQLQAHITPHQLFWSCVAPSFKEKAIRLQICLRGRWTMLVGSVLDVLEVTTIRAMRAIFQILTIRTVVTSHKTFAIRAVVAVYAVGAVCTVVAAYTVRAICVVILIIQGRDFGSAFIRRAEIRTRKYVT
jgi:hypothetical protein